MKTLNLGLILAVCFSLCGCATCKKATPSGDSADEYVKLLCIATKVDGSDRIIFTRQSVRLEHKNRNRPTHVLFDGRPWVNLYRTPAGWRDQSGRLDLSKAWIVKRQGRDVIALEHTAKGFDLYLCDSPNGSADYEVTIAIPRRN
jgi:hypothetical protein